MKLNLSGYNCNLRIPKYYIEVNPTFVLSTQCIPLFNIAGGYKNNCYELLIFISMLIAVGFNITRDTGYSFVLLLCYAP